MDARLTQAEAAYFTSVGASPARDRAVAQRLAAGKAYEASLLHGAIRGLARLGNALFGWVERARVKAQLDSLTDRDLADIGLTRNDIGRVIGTTDVAVPTRRPDRIGAQQSA
ncbi:DUF1127 domain-containing protein [Dankookia sp. GCM10030260]|uniref:DUF1127 domain-containing protein n=1 Tax=Dankookia sp. GCM10030260 TaxID=3273390 RepID=UPI00361FFF65